MKVNKNIDVSVIIPVFNQEKFLPKCLDSICFQTFKNIEIIIINDASTDRSLEIINEYAEKDSRIVVFNQTKNCGQGASRNLGIDIAKGEFLMFCDPDDWYEQNFCELAYRQITENNNDIVICNYYIYEEELQEKRITSQFKRSFDKLHNCFNLNVFEYDIPFVNSCWNQIFRASLIKNNNCRFSFSKHGEDLPFIASAFLSANSISILDKALYNYKKSSNAEITRLETNKYRVRNYNEIFNNRRVVYELIKSVPNSQKYLEEYLIYCVEQNINSFKYFVSCDVVNSEEIYQKIRELFVLIYRDGFYKKVKKYIPYLEFMKFVRNSTYKSYLFYSNIMSLFSFTKYIRYDMALYSFSIFGCKLSFKKQIKI